MQVTEGDLKAAPMPRLAHLRPNREDFVAALDADKRQEPIEIDGCRFLVERCRKLAGKLDGPVSFEITYQVFAPDAGLFATLASNFPNDFPRHLRIIDS